jgi:predicted kinase
LKPTAARENPSGHPLKNDADAALLREVLDDDLARTSGPSARPVLLVLAGLPGTGKTHFAKRLLERLSFLVLETDRLRKVLVSSPRYTPGENRRLFDACHLLAREYLASGHPVLFDATNLTERFRTPLYQIAESLDRPFATVEVTAPREVVRRRLRSREAGLDRGTNSDAGWLIYCRMAPAWEPILRKHHVVDSSADITPVLEQVVSWASQAESSSQNLS